VVIAWTRSRSRPLFYWYVSAVAYAPYQHGVASLGSRQAGHSTSARQAAFGLVYQCRTTSFKENCQCQPGLEYATWSSDLDLKLNKMIFLTTRQHALSIDDVSTTVHNCYLAGSYHCYAPAAASCKGLRTICRTVQTTSLEPARKWR
jgi:hypothetical protein